MRAISVKQLRRRLEERRRRALGLVKAIDRCGLSPERLNQSALLRLAQCDGDCLAWLARLASLPARSEAPSDWEQIAHIERQMDELEIAILKSVPASDRRAVVEAHQVAMLIVEDGEIYDGISRPRR